jgi:hypothetical protein
MTGEFLPKASNKTLSIFEITIISSLAVGICIASAFAGMPLASGPTVDAAHLMSERIVDIGTVANKNPRNYIHIEHVPKISDRSSIGHGKSLIGVTLGVTD